MTGIKMDIEFNQLFPRFDDDQEKLIERVNVITLKRVWSNTQVQNFLHKYKLKVKMLEKKEMSS